MKNSVSLICCFLFVLTLNSGILVQAQAPPTPRDSNAEAQEEAKNQEGDKTKKSEDESKDEKKNTTRRGRQIKSKKAKEFVTLFDSVIASATDSTVQIVSEDEQVAVGTVVDTNGLILTKASTLGTGLECVLGNGTKTKATVLGVHPETDLALLKVDLENLPVGQWAESTNFDVGRWLATPNFKGPAIAIGVISVTPRKIKPIRAFMGINLRDFPFEDEEKKFKNVPNGIEITNVLQGSPAYIAKLKPEDIIVKVDDVDVGGAAELQKTLGQYDPTDRVVITYYRKGKKAQTTVKLSSEDKVNPSFSRSNQQNSMGSKLSKRRKDFPLAFQHDSMLNAKECGGPIVDLDGKIIGINIARSGRVSSLALPSQIVLPIIEELKTGKWEPAVIYAEKIKVIDSEIADVEKEIAEIPERQAELQKRFDSSEFRQAEIKRLMKELEARLKDIENEDKSSKSKIEALNRERRGLERKKKRLQNDRSRLKSGGMAG